MRALVLALLAASAAQAQNLYTFSGTTQVGSSTAAQAVTVTLPNGGNVATVEVLTMGAPRLDYTETSDNCVSNFGGSSTCTVNVVFAPKYPGTRNGAVVLLDSGKNTLATEYLSGTGTGSLGVMLPGTISVVAGQLSEWTNVGDGGLATQADLYLPSGVAVDGAGDIFIADSHHNRVREVLAQAQGTLGAGDITTVAGDGSAGYDPSATGATTTSLNLPGGVAIDGAGNLYIADTNDNVIREVNLNTETITTVAGNGQPGYSGDNGAATAAELSSPSGVAVDAAGDLFIADTDNNAIREVNAVTRKITTIAGTGAAGYAGDAGQATKAELSAPYGVAFDAQGDMFIPDSGNNVIREVMGGTISTYAGDGSAAHSGDGSPAKQAELNSPLGVACDPAGNVYIADARNYVIRKVSASTGLISTVAGNNHNSGYGDGKGGYVYGNGQLGETFPGQGIASGAPADISGAGIYAPYAVAVDPAGNLLIAEYFDHLIRKVTANEATLFFSPELWQNQVSAPQQQVLENDGNAPLNFTQLSYDANAAIDAGSTTCSTSTGLGVDAQCDIGAEFAPTVSGNPVVGNINITGDPADSPLNIQVVGQSLSQNQVSVTLTSTPNPSAYGQNVTFGVNVAQSPNSTEGTPTGTVSFTDTFQGTTNPIGSAVTLNGGNATLQLGSLAVGTHSIVANYSGNTYYSSAASNAVQQVVQEQITVNLSSSSPNDTSTLGSSVTFTAAVSISGGVAASGSVSFYDGATYIGSGTLQSGVAAFATAGLAVGSNSITATYTDVNKVTASSAPLTQMVEQQTATTLLSNVNPSIHGNPVTFTATVLATGSVAPSGTVNFFDGSTQIGSGRLTTSGTTSAIASFQTSSLTAGSHTITATYGGDTNDFGSTSPAVTQTVQDATSATTLSASLNPAPAGKPITLDAVVTSNGATPTGTVNFYAGSTLLGTGIVSSTGVATMSISTLAVGTYSVTAAYQGDANDTASTSAPLGLTIVDATTSVQLTSSNPSIYVTNPVTFTAVVNGNGGTPSGTVTFQDGGNTIGTGTLNNGIASFTTSSLATGKHTITATYGGDANDAAVTSTPLTETVTAYGTQTNLAASTNNLTTDQQITLLTTTTASGGGALTGTITFMNGTTSLGSAQMGPNGASTLTLSLNAGSYNIVAQYSGDAVNAPSTSNPVAVAVTQATEFTIQLSPTSLSIPTAQSATLSINLASENGFTDKIALGCGSLPYSVTCTFANNDVTLNNNGTASVQLTVDTNSPLASGAQAKNETGNNGMVAAFAFPGALAFGLGFWRFRKRTGVLKVLTVIAVLAGTTFLMTGCGGFSLNSAKPGSYVIQIQATGEQTGITHVANLTVQVTQ